jgi:8-amino-7-oxononanoate synthase
MDQKLRNKIAKRKEEGTLRSLSSFNDHVDFFSNDYLGLSRVEIPMEETFFGGTGARLISGTKQSTLTAEQELAAFFGAENSIMFNSGYDANLGFFSAVPQRGDTIVYDELIHASVRDGIRLGFASSVSFRHNDVIDLEQKIKQSKGSVYVAVEALYSMDGDIALLIDITTVTRRLGAYLIVDEAHSTGVFGDKGKGLVNAMKLEEFVFARLVTFGKAYGSHGGLILGSKELIEFITNFARSFIYTTALPPAAYIRAGLIVHYPDINERRNELLENIAFFRSFFSADELHSDDKSPIQILQVGQFDKIKKSSEELLKNQIAVKPIFSPTVPSGQERLRICLHSFNSKKEIEKLTNLVGRK